MNPKAFQRAMGRMPQRIPFGKLVVPSTPKPLPREALMHFWYPEREGVEQAPPRTQKQLARIHRDLRAVRPPASAPTPSHAWAIWYRKPEITHELSPGWFMFFVWQERGEHYDDSKGMVTTLTPLSLDDPRLIANIYRFSAMGEFKSAEAHFRNVVDRMQATKTAQRKADDDRRHDIGHDFFQYRKVKNIGHGSKFSTHHDGTIVPSKGHLANLRARGTRDQPGEVTERELRDRERRQDRKGR